MSNLYYISFATKTEFLGATVVEGVSENNALEVATNNGLNPGGQAVILCVPEQCRELPDVAPLKYKLFNKEQMKALGAISWKGNRMKKPFPQVLKGAATATSNILARTSKTGRKHKPITMPKMPWDNSNIIEGNKKKDIDTSK